MRLSNTTSSIRVGFILRANPEVNEVTEVTQLIRLMIKLKIKDGTEGVIKEIKD